jgi:hypothetical protein
VTVFPGPGCQLDPPWRDWGIFVDPYVTAWAGAVVTRAPWPPGPQPVITLTMVISAWEALTLRKALPVARYADWTWTDKHLSWGGIRLVQVTGIMISPQQARDVREGADPVQVLLSEAWPLRVRALSREELMTGAASR